MELQIEKQDKAKAHGDQSRHVTARPSQGYLGVDTANDPEVRQQPNESTAMFSPGEPDITNTYCR